MGGGRGGNSPNMVAAVVLLLGMHNRGGGRGEDSEKKFGLSLTGSGLVEGLGIGIYFRTRYLARKVFICRKYLFSWLAKLFFLHLVLECVALYLYTYA